MLAGAKKIIIITCRFDIQVGDHTIQSSRKARNLGVIFDSHLDMHTHITSMCRSAMYHLRRISSIRRFLDRGATETLSHAFISSRLDYCNSLLIGLPTCELDRHQRVQNVAAKILTFTRRREHIRPVLYLLHWLPVSARIEFNVVTMTFKCLHGMAPKYVTELLDIYNPPRDLRFAMELILCERRSILKSAGDNSFSIVAPKLFNSIPNDLREITSLTTFKSKLKTFLFRKLYHDVMIN